MKTLIMILAFAPWLATVNAGDANWPMGSPDGSWSMGSAETGWQMNGRQAAIASHEIRIGFSFDEVRRALGKPTETSTTVTASMVRDFWHYEVGGHLLVTVMFDNGRVAAFSN
jgi:hypothetical protein